MGYVTVTYSNPYFTNPFEKVAELKESVDKVGDGMVKFAETVAYWINPINWFIEANKGLYWLVHHPETGNYLVVATIVSIWLMMLGANTPKKYVFWGWIVYWFLRAVVYNF